MNNRTHACAALVRAFALILLVIGGSALAQDEPDNGRGLFHGITPDNPAAGQPFVLNVHQGPCELLSEDPNSATILPLNGNVLTVRITGFTTLFCNIPAPRERSYGGTRTMAHTAARISNTMIATTPRPLCCRGR